MNCYKTFSSRTSPQIIQRQFDTTINGTRYTAHGIKGANGEWTIEAYTGQWTFLGYARKRGTGWIIETDNGTSTGRTLTEVIVAAFPISHTS